MKKISTMIFISIFLCVAAGTLITAGMSITFSSEEIKKEAENRMEALSGQYANNMNTLFGRYETMVESINHYVQSTYDSGKLGDVSYNEAYLAELNEFIYTCLFLTVICWAFICM